MRGSIKRRYEGSYSLILDLGYQVDPATGHKRRKQKWVTFRGTRKEAETKLTELCGRATAASSSSRRSSRSVNG
jgi:hypothetical protein